jgi:hypothetical protein
MLSDLLATYQLAMDMHAYHLICSLAWPVRRECEPCPGALAALAHHPTLRRLDELELCTYPEPPCAMDLGMALLMLASKHRSQPGNDGARCIGIEHVSPFFILSPTEVPPTEVARLFWPLSWRVQARRVCRRYVSSCIVRTRRHARVWHKRCGST